MSAPWAIAEEGPLEPATVAIARDLGRIAPRHRLVHGDPEAVGS